MEASEKRIFRLALTGGPCAGKTTALSILRQKLGDIGFYVVTVPEAATILINMGIGPKMIGIVAFQHRVFELIVRLEEVALSGIKDVKHKKVVVLHDRGIPDGRAFISGSEFEGILSSYRSNMPEVRDKRYDAVFHLRTTAIGAEVFYTNASNEARYESLEEARVVDEKILSAWVGHPHLRVLNNSTSFEEKLSRLYKEVCSVLGVPIPLEIERKYLIRPFDVAEHISVFQVIDIEQAYLDGPNNDESLRVRRRGQDGSFVYYMTVKKELSSGVRMEREEQISEENYFSGVERKLPGTRVIKKKRTCFVFNETYFEYDRFEDPAGIHILEIELTDRSQNIELPPYIEVVREVTDDKAYANRTIAQKGAPYEST